MTAVGPVYRAWNFGQTIGVNAHMAWQNPGSAYADVAVVEASLAYLGATHVRDGVPYSGWTLPEYQAVAATGVKFDIVVTTPNIDIAGDLWKIDQLAKAAPGSIASVEGANEFNTNYNTFNGVNSFGNPAWAKLFGPALYAAVKADPTLSGVPVIASSMANAGATQIWQEGDVSGFADSSNWHEYYGNGNQPAQGLAYVVAQAKSTAPAKPVTITETGYYTAVDAMDWGGGGVSPAVQAILTVNALLDAFHDGVQTTYLYELMDNIANPSSTDLENSFGLFKADGTPKPAAAAIHNLTAILADTGVNASTFQTGTLAATIDGLPATGNTMAFQKANGTSDLVIWNEPTVWNQATRSQVTPAAVSIKVNLGATYSLVKVFDPLAGSAPIQILTGVSSVQLALTADPLIVEVVPLPPPQTYSPGAAGGTINSQGADTVLVGSGAVTLNASGPSIHVVGGAGALTYSGSAKAVIAGGSGAMSLTLSGSGSMVSGGSGGLAVLDQVGGNVIQGAPGNANNGMSVTTTAGDDQISTGAWTAGNVIHLGSGNDTVVANGTSAVTGSTGNDTITVNGWWGDVTTGIGSSTVTMNAGGVVTTGGRDTVRASAGLTLTANGPATTVAGGSGFMWFSGHGSAAITGGSGGGFFDLTRITGGVITTAASAADTIQTGAAGGTVVTQGTDTVQLGAGAASVSALIGTVTVQAGSGGMTFIEGAANATVYAGSGVESFTLTKGQAGHALTIHGFAPGNDTIHLVGYGQADVHTQFVGGATQIQLSDNSLITLAGFASQGWHPTVGA